MKVDIYIRVDGIEDNGTQRPYNIYNKFQLNLKTDIRDFNLLINEITDAIRKEEASAMIDEISTAIIKNKDKAVELPDKE